MLFDVVDARGKAVSGALKLRIESLETGRAREARIAGGGRIEIPEPRSGAPRLYRVRITATAYRPVQLFAGSHRDAMRITLPVRPSRVKQVVFPEFARLPPGAKPFLGSGGRARWERLGDQQRGGFLNIVSKCAATRFPSGESVLGVMGRQSRVIRFRRDRLFCRVPKALFGATIESVPAGTFHRVNGALHRQPGYTRVASFKTPDAYGNLQITFFRRGPAWLADIDIDDAAGLEHVFQVLRNAVRREPTHPYDIQQILLAKQGIDPGYDLIV